MSGEELVSILMEAYKSLEANGLHLVKNGKLKDLIRQVKCFGLGLLPLDCRNEGVRHSEALAAITECTFCVNRWHLFVIIPSPTLLEIDESMNQFTNTTEKTTAWDPT